MDLESGRIDEIGIEKCTADYVIAHNDNIESYEDSKEMTVFSMMTLDTNKEVYGILNNAIKEMKADGTLDNLIENELKAYIESDPVAKELPHFDGARTIKIGVTGDVPPMDFVAANGKADMYSLVQANIDAAEKAGADYVIALSHVGYDESDELFDITDIIENTDGFDVVLDAHAHLVIENKTIKDKSGDDVLLSSTGTKFEYIGKLTITEDGPHTELVETATYEKTDATVDAYLAEINESYAELGNRVIGESTVTLNDYDGDTRLVRNSETALGNLCSDALRVMTGADVSFVNGGGLRAPIEAGEVTFNDIFSVFPYNNQVVTVEITGQMLLDMLEMGVMNYPEENGSFPSMSGVTFSLNTAIPTSVKTDENGFFTGVDGEYRVYGVKVLDKESGEYRDLDPNKKYVLAGFNYHLLSQGDGMAMFKDANPTQAEGTLDIELLENYIVDHLGGTIGEEYAQPQGRITFTEG